ncbi:succinate-semialdehyde dehydrogenase / glutarate-semialdehyde dehydrogenase [Flaviramulus basaltis]|uniref:Succinate-semialdehyde dehydrogenase / glutarate-semialdehyde dehydrogenase n=1 Tax=Flaviramulus basaltis TaxID=369401 RepID=A0A1K2IIX3_9FLAO|nr:NAD-dependent succinate-semialdehyde dehydrogenase [Flaviramulus basaltis]SFZ92364.1 succinate-semialdehyde dehydrogenase / glutarate-semialdehyde dehydrogenase [Flaviramulus basaltis]
MTEKMKSVNPYNQKIIKSYNLHTPLEIENKVKLAEEIFTIWREKEIKERTKLLSNVSNLLEERIDSLSKLITQEMGKPINESIAEINKCIFLCDFYTLNAEDFLADQIIETDAKESFISYDPLGVILAIMPWNYPFWQVFRFAVPTLTAGNTALLKHASNVSGCALAIQEIFEDAGYPKGCFQTLITNHDIIENILKNDIIKAVSLTGSEKAGRHIAKIAGEYLKKSVLELGGNNACIVLDDANLEKYLDTMVKARMQNTGQSCIAAKRFIVTKGIYDEFVEKFTKKVKDLKFGNPIEQDTKIGPLARIELAENLEKQVNDALLKGAKVIIGNKRNKAYYSPTILTEVTEDMTVFTEETFGPVAPILKVDNLEEAIKMATNSKFGLGTMLFTENVELALHAISKIPDGAFFINDMVKSDPRLPFGGTKASGYGRELSKEGIHEFINKKTVYIKK